MPDPKESEVNSVVVRLAQQGAQGPDLVQKAAALLHCSAAIVRRLVQNRYPGLMTKPLKERVVVEQGLQRDSGGRFKVPARGNDLYRLPARKRQGGHTF